MRAIILGAALAVASPVMAQPPAYQAVDPAPVIAAERAFAADFPALGMAGSFQKWSRPDAVIINRGRARTVTEVFAGKPMTRQPGEPLLEWWPTFVGVALSGDLGFSTGPAAENGTPYGHYLTIWRRQADGSWRWVYDGGSAADPAGQPDAASEPRILPIAAVGSSAPEQAAAEVAVIEAQLAAAARTDQKAAHLAFLAGDGRLYVARERPAEGQEAFRSALAHWPTAFDFGVAQGGGASDAGDLVWTYGPASWTRDDRTDHGHYMRVWQKRPEGWRIVLAQMIAAPPPAGG